MLSVLAKNELLEEAERLYARRDFVALVRLLKPTPQRLYATEPELGYHFAQALFQTGDHRKAARIANLCAPALTRRSNDRASRRFINLRAILTLFRGELNESTQLLNELFAMAAAGSDPEFLACSTLNLGIIADIRLRWAEAIAAYNRALTIYACGGNFADLGACHNNLGITYRQMGEYSRAAENLSAALSYFEQCSSEAMVLGCKSELAILRHCEGDAEVAERSARDLLQRCRGIRNSYLAAEVLKCLGIVVSRTRPLDAQRYFLRAAESAERGSDRLLQAEAYEGLAGVCRGRKGGNKSALAATLARDLYRAIGAAERARRVEDRFLGTGDNLT